MIVEETKKTGPGTDTLSDEELKEYSEKAEAIAKEKSFSQVHVCVMITPKTFERRASFISHPNFLTQLSIIDKMTSIGIYQGANALREACTLKEQSDPITYGDSPECDGYKMGATNFCIGIIESFRNQYKKK